MSMQIAQFLQEQQEKETLRFITCGSVDDGKSTLIGRLLYDSKLIYEDQLEALEADSAKVGTQGDKLDLALLVDGLAAEREQGITIDVAYRYFSTKARKFIVADTPGHEQYTRNMVTGASTADLAVILGRQAGHPPRTRRTVHRVVARSSTSCRHQQDGPGRLVRAAVEELKRDYNNLSRASTSAICTSSPCAPWRETTSWIEASACPVSHRRSWTLNNVQISSDRNLVDLRFPVQYVNRPDHTFRGYCGTMASGVVRPGDEVMVLPLARQHG